MNNLAQRIVEAIFKQEGMGPTHTNPGNLRDCPWFPRANSISRTRNYNDGTEVQYKNNFWVPRSRAEGEAGALHVVALHIAEGDTLSQLIGGKPGYSGWAPPSENYTATYISNVKQWAQIPFENLPLWNFLVDPTLVS